MRLLKEDERQDVEALQTRGLRSRLPGPGRRLAPSMSQRRNEMSMCSRRAVGCLLVGISLVLPHPGTASSLMRKFADYLRPVADPAADAILL